MNRWNVIFAVVVSITAFAEPPPVWPPKVWVIAHMTNSVGAVEWAANAGANGVEADLRFDNGFPAKFQHSEKLTELCDCSCGKGAPNMEVCTRLGHDPCRSSVTVAKWFAAVVAQSEKLGLVVIDSKVDRHTSPDAGERLIKTLESELFDTKYKGMAIIGASKFEALPYLRAAAAAAAASKYAGRIYFTLDGEESRTEDVLQALVELPSGNIVYGTGISACSWKQFPNATLLGEVNRRAGVIGFNYIWTIDKYESVEMYLEKGAGGIMTNDPVTAVTKVKAMRNVMAAPHEFFPKAIQDDVVTAVPKCDCKYNRRGCVIDKMQRAPPNWACKCELATVAPLTCYGSVVVCKDAASDACRTPGTDEDSCKQGRGNCKGYQ